MELGKLKLTLGLIEPVTLIPRGVSPPCLIGSIQLRIHLGNRYRNRCIVNQIPMGCVATVLATLDPGLRLEASVRLDRHNQGINARVFPPFQIRLLVVLLLTGKL